MDDIVFFGIVVIVIFAASFVLLYIQNGPNQRQRQANAPTGTARSRAANGGSHTNIGSRVCMKDLTPSQKSWHFKLPEKYGRRVLTIDATEILCSKDSVVRIIEENISILADLAQIAQVYIISRIEDVSEKEAIREAFRSEGLLQSVETPKGLKPNRLMFCNSTIGRIAMVRQLEPEAHFESCDDVITKLQKHVPMIVRVSSQPSYLKLEPNVIGVQSSSLRNFYEQCIAA